MGSELVEPPEEPERQEHDPQLLERFFENQSRELELRAQEHELNKQKDNNNLEYAKRSLEAQERDRTHLRQCLIKQRRELMIFVGIVIVALLVALGAFAYMGKEAMAIGLVEKIVPLAAVLFGGYGYGRYRTSQDPPPPRDSQNEQN